MYIKKKQKNVDIFHFHPVHFKLQYFEVKLKFPLLNKNKIILYHYSILLTFI